MNSYNWKLLKEELISKGFDVTVKGRDKCEYIAINDFMSVDIYRRGVSRTGSIVVMYVFDSNQDIVCEISDNSYDHLISAIDTIIDGYNQFGDVMY